MSIVLNAASITERLPQWLRRHKLMNAWMLLTGEHPIQLVRIRDNSYGYADMRDGFLRLIPIEGAYDEDFFSIADALLSNGGTFFDVGANYGLLSFGLAGRHGNRIDFHLFEPNPALTDVIVRSSGLYPFMRCAVNAVAVSGHAGMVRFTINSAQSGASHIATADDVGGLDVPAITLDNYISERNIARVELLKLDVEGFELSACRGAEKSFKSRMIQAVYFEYFEKFLVREDNPNRLIEYLDSVDFVSCFCRRYDFEALGSATHTIVEGLPGHGLRLLPIEGLKRPSMTDLLAIPRENLALLRPQLG